MIDTDKYEGHSTEYSYEIVSVDDDKEMDATYALLNDAPLLLDEVKRLRKQLLKGVTYMNKTPNQTKDGRRQFAKRFEREVKEMIE